MDISIVVPVYNVERYVVECIQSILEQKTNYSYEIIAVDDGSTDSSGTLIDSLAKHNACMKVIHQVNRGFSGARNAGLENIKGEFVMFVDSDDYLESTALETLLNVLREDQALDYVTANYSTMDEHGANIRCRGIRNHGAPWGRLFRRNVWRHLCFPEGFWFEDTIQAYCISGQFKERYLNEPLYRWRRNANSITGTCIKSKKAIDTYWIVEEMIHWCRLLDIRFTQRIYDQTIKQLGPTAIARIDALSKNEKRALFVCACHLLESVPEFKHMRVGKRARYKDVELALRTRNMRLWEVASLGC